MDPNILQLFSAEEILERLGSQERTGCFHVFTSQESANVFFKNGLVVAAVKGLSEGEEALKQIVHWKEARTFWQPDVPAASPPLQALQINIGDFLAKNKPGKKAPRPPASFTESAHVHFSIPSKGATTSQLPGAPSPDKLDPTPSITLKAASATRADMVATKNIDTGQNRSLQEEELLQKYKLVLVSREAPEIRFNIAKVSSLIGRNPACDITISHPSISRQHCLLQITDRGLHVKDLDTVNGTTVNGIALKEGYINAGDKLTIGRVPFVLEKQ